MTGPVAAEMPDDFDSIPGLMQQRLDALVGSGHLYTTDAEGLFDRFLASLPPHQQQHYTCSPCRKFVERYGGLAAIDDRVDTSRRCGTGTKTR